jgi:site-specific recombinase XerD
LDVGYSQSAAKKHRQLAAQLSAWLDAEQLGPHELTAARTERFFQQRRDAGRPNLRTPRALDPLLAFLRRSGIPEPEAPVVTDSVRLFLERYRGYLRSERGLVEGTVRFYAHIAGLFVSTLVGRDGLDFTRITPAQIAQFAEAVCAGRGLSSARQAISALRSLLRYLRWEGVTVEALDQAVLSVAGWSTAWPRPVDADRVTRLLSTCDRRSPIELRDRAVLMLLARLGLRGGEVVALELDDIDWRSGEFIVRGKGRHHERLPLPAEVGAAVAAYLRGGRPRSDSRRVFLRHYAPVRGLAGTGAIRSILHLACARAGTDYISPHRLRHTAATEMLRAGAPLAEIAQVLRHRSATTTFAYAAVDVERLRPLARPWLGGAA